MSERGYGALWTPEIFHHFNLVKNKNIEFYVPPLPRKLIKKCSFWKMRPFQCYRLRICRRWRQRVKDTVWFRDTLNNQILKSIRCKIPFLVHEFELWCKIHSTTDVLKLENQVSFFWTHQQNNFSQFTMNFCQSWR